MPKRFVAALLAAAVAVLGVAFVQHCHWALFSSAPGPARQPTEERASTPAPVPPAQPEATEPTPKPAALSKGDRAGSESGGSELQGAGSAAIRKAQEAKKYAFLLFHENEAEPTRNVRKTLESAIAKMPDKAMWAAVDRSAPQEAGLVEKFGLRSAPMPLVLVLAPNGAVTAGFTAEGVSEPSLQGALVSPVLETCLKALQDRKLVLLCAQNAATKSNVAATRGVDDFKADARFARFTEIVRVDPTDTVEGKLLAQLQIDPKTDEAVTALLAPPRVLIATIKGATTKEQFLEALKKAASSSCGPTGCSPGGCK